MKKETKSKLNLMEVKMSKTTPYKVGKKYMIRTVTMIYTGKLKQIFDKELILTECAWIPETKRWADSCKTGEFNEVEPYPEKAEIVIGREAILDAFNVEWNLPRNQKWTRFYLENFGHGQGHGQGQG